MVLNENQRYEVAADMQHKMEERPKLLSPSAGKSDCCIFRVPQNLVKIKAEAFYPSAVSIGPYHHGEKHLQMLEQHKWRFLSSLMVRCRDIHVQDLIEAISFEEVRIRASYSECTDMFSSSELVKMMVLDGCFIIEFLSICGNLVPPESDEPILNVTWIGYAVLQDLYKLENQMPYFVLQILFDRTRFSRPPDTNKRTTLADLVLNCFNTTLGRPSDTINYYVDRINKQIAPKHLLDLCRSSFVIPRSTYDTDTGHEDRPAPLSIQSTQTLRKDGIMFKRKKDPRSFLDISFKDGILEMPFLKLDSHVHDLLLNLMAFEQCYCYYRQRITSYIMFMACLINSSADSEYLQKKGIINKYVGTHEHIVHIFNQIHNVTFFQGDFYLASVVEDINKYCSSYWHVGWSGIKHKYFSAPWAWIAVIGALLGLLLAFTQTVFTVLGYFHQSTN